MTREREAMDHECQCCLLHTCLVGMLVGMVEFVSWKKRKVKMGGTVDEVLGNVVGSAVDVTAGAVVGASERRKCRARLETPGEDPLRLESAGCYCMRNGVRERVVRR